jgi:hypothetical protein
LRTRLQSAWWLSNGTSRRLLRKRRSNRMVGDLPNDVRAIDSMVTCFCEGSDCGGVSTQRLWSHQSDHPGKGDDGAGRTSDHRSIRYVRRAIPRNRGRMWIGARDLPSMVCLPVVGLSRSRHVCLTFLLAGGWHTTISTTIVNFSKNMAIWGGLMFIAGTPMQPSFLPSRAMECGVGAKTDEQTGAIHVEGG